MPSPAEVPVLVVIPRVPDEAWDIVTNPPFNDEIPVTVVLLKTPVPLTPYPTEIKEVLTPIIVVPLLVRKVPVDIPLKSLVTFVVFVPIARYTVPMPNEATDTPIPIFVPLTAYPTLILLVATPIILFEDVADKIPDLWIGSSYLTVRLLELTSPFTRTSPMTLS